VITTMAGRADEGDVSRYVDARAPQRVDDADRATVVPGEHSGDPLRPVEQPTCGAHPGLLLRIRDRRYRAIREQETADDDRDGVPDAYQGGAP
jgi:hypothetical protein